MDIPWQLSQKAYSAAKGEHQPQQRDQAAQQQECSAHILQARHDPYHLNNVQLV
jgi:hypothetical protein